MSEDITTSEYMMKWRVFPDCCDEMRRTKAIQLTYLFEQEYDAATKPIWGVHGHVKLGRESSATEYRTRVEAKFCPFCAKPVPEIQLKAKPPKKVQKITDGGYYCDCCHKRCNECVCAPCWAAWEIKPIILPAEEKK